MKANEAPDLAVKRLMASTSMLDQDTGSSRSYLLDCAKLEASLGLAPLEGEEV